MNIENLQEGMVFKNFLALCETLGIEPKTSTSREKQKKMIKQYARVSKNGHKIKIEEVYNKPIIVQENRGDVFGSTIQLLIIEYLIEHNLRVATFTINYLMKSISMVNHNYEYSRNNIKKVSKHIELSEQYLYEFFNTTQSNFVSTIQTAMKNLQKRLVIDFDRVTMIKTDNGEHRMADEDERIHIKECEKAILNKLSNEKTKNYKKLEDRVINKEYKDIGDIMFTKDWEKFKTELTLLLNKNSKIEYTYQAYKIMVNERFIDEEQNEMLIQYFSDSVNTKTRDELNDYLCFKVLNNAIKRQNKARKKTDKNKEMNQALRKLRTNFSYMKSIKKLTSLMIDKDTKADIKKEIKESENSENSENSDKVDTRVKRVFNI